MVPVIDVAFVFRVLQEYLNTVYVMQSFDRDEAHLDRVTLVGTVVGVLVSES